MNFIRPIVSAMDFISQLLLSAIYGATYQFKRFFLRVMYGNARVDAYLAEMRGDKLEAAEWESFAESIKQQIQDLDINRRFS